MENHFEKEVTGQNKQPARILPLPHPMGREYIYIYISKTLHVCNFRLHSGGFGGQCRHIKSWQSHGVPGYVLIRIVTFLSLNNPWGLED